MKGEGRITRALAATDKQAIRCAFGTTTIPRRDRDVTNGGFPHERYKPRKLRLTASESPDSVTPNVNHARTFPNMQTLTAEQKAGGVRGRTELHERVSTMNKNENPQVGGHRASEEEGRWHNVNF